MMPFSPEVQRVLEESGWHENRRIDISGYEQSLRAAGYDDGKHACEFLAQYGDLEVDAGLGETCLNTFLSESILSVPVSSFSAEVGRALYRIGSCNFDFMSLLMDSSGRVYRHMDRTCQNFGGIDLYLIAASGEEAIEKLIGEHQTDADIQGEWMAHKD